eukprot:535955_1
MTLLSILCVLIWYLSSCKCNDVPVIGILSVPCLPQVAAHDCPSWTGVKAKSYIAASYVKFLEAGGAKVVPILSTDSIEDVSKLVLKLNGVLLTGGTEYFNSTSIYYNQVKNILNTMRQYNKANPTKSIPLWATCLGFQALVCATSKTGPTILKGGYNAYNTALNVNFSPYGKTSRMFDSTMPSSYSSSVYTKMGTEDITWNDHGGGFNPTDFENDMYLSANFSIIGNSFAPLSRKNFVTLIESKSNLGLSWYGAQFHPEKPQYEFASSQGLHSLDSVFGNQYLTEFFVNECRTRNNIVMDESTLNEIVIYNYDPYYVDKNGGSSFEQNYLFT